MSAHWPLTRLGEVFEIARGGSPRPIEQFITDRPDGLNWVKIGDATSSGKYIERTKEKIKREGLPKTRQVAPGDFLLTNSMSFGRPYIMATHGCIHDGWLVLKPVNREKVDEGYFYHLLGSDAVYAKFSSRAAGSTVKNLNTDIVSSIEIPLPPLDEQRRIAAILDKADALRRKRKRALDLLDGLTRSIFHQVFADSGGTEVLLADLVDPADRINYGVIQPGDPAPNGAFLIRAGDLRAGKVDRSNLRTISPDVSAQYNRSLLKGGEILIGCVGSIGEVAIAAEEDRGSNIARAVARVPLAKDISPTYVAEFLRTADVQNYFRAELRTVAQPTLNIKQITETRVMMPPASSIRVFESVIDRVRQNVDRLAASGQTLEKMFTSLQHRAFSGQL